MNVLGPARVESREVAARGRLIKIALRLKLREPSAHVLRDPIALVERALPPMFDARGELWPFYRAWRDGFASDHSGEKAFTRVVGGRRAR